MVGCREHQGNTNLWLMLWNNFEPQYRRRILRHSWAGGQTCLSYVTLESKSTGTGFCGVNSPNPCGVLSQSATHDCWLFLQLLKKALTVQDDPWYLFNIVWAFFNAYSHGFSMHTHIVVMNYAASGKDTKVYGLRPRRQSDIVSTACFGRRENANDIVSS